MGSEEPRTKRRALVLALSLLAGSAAGCAAERAAGRADPERRPSGLPDGAFSWQEIRGGHDRLDAFQDLRDRTIALVEQALSLPGRPAGASSGSRAPRDESGRSAADRALEAMRSTFDVARAPEELLARIAYFDRGRARHPGDAPGGDSHEAEGIEIRLERHLAEGRSRALSVRLEDFARDGSVDGRLDRITIRWAAAPPAAPALDRLAVDLSVERGEVFGSIELGDEARFGVTSPHLGPLIGRAEVDLYRHIAATTFARAVRDGTAPVKLRPAPPRGTSFPATPAGEEEPH